MGTQLQRYNYFRKLDDLVTVFFDIFAHPDAGNAKMAELKL